MISLIIFTLTDKKLLKEVKLPICVICFLNTEHSKWRLVRCFPWRNLSSLQFAVLLIVSFAFCFRKVTEKPEWVLRGCCACYVSLISPVHICRSLGRAEVRICSVHVWKLIQWYGKPQEQVGCPALQCLWWSLPYINLALLTMSSSTAQPFCLLCYRWLFKTINSQRTFSSFFFFFNFSCC